jgi:hypothetical protein
MFFAIGFGSVNGSEKLYAVPHGNHDFTLVVVFSEVNTVRV